MKTFSITFLFLTIIHFCSGQKLEMVFYLAPEDITESIQLNDSLLSKYQKKPFYIITASDSSSNKSKTLRHFWDFYRSENVYQKDSIHAKKQINSLKPLIEIEIRKEIENDIDHYLCGGPISLRILKEARKASVNCEIEKSLEYYERYLIIKPNDLIVIQEYEKILCDFQNFQK